MTSPGEAYMNYVDSKEGHNAAAVTPEYLKENDNKSKFDKELEKARNNDKEDVDKSDNMNKEQVKQIDNAKVKDKEKER